MLYKLNKQIAVLNTKPPIHFWWLLLFLIIVFIPHLFMSIELYHTATMYDLELRVTGSRLLSAGKNPYFYIWQVGDAVEFYNPNLRLHSPVNAVTSTPFTLWLQKHFAANTYCFIRKVWWGIQEILLFASVLLCWQMPTSRAKQIVAIAITSVFFLFSCNWWLHLYAGQMYIMYTFVFSVTTYLVLVRKKQDFLFFVYPLMALVRPFYAVALLPYFSFKKKQIWILITSGILCLLLLYTSTNKSVWQEYFKAIDIYATESTKGEQWHAERTNPHYFTTTIQAEACTEIYGKSSFSIDAGCLYSVQHYLVKMGIKISDSKVFVLGLLCAIILFFLLAFKRKVFYNPMQTIAFSFLLYILCELFTPASRNPYGMMQWLPFVCLAIMGNNKIVWWLMLVGLLLNHALPPMLYGRELGELLMLISLVFFVFDIRYSTSIKQNLKA